MANLHDIIALIETAEQRESNPADAHGRYETAERLIEETLVDMGFTREIIIQYPNNFISQRFLPLYNRIIAGYARLTVIRGAIFL